MRNRRSSLSLSLFHSENEWANKRATRVEHFTTDWPLGRNKSGSKEGWGQREEGRGDTCNLPPLFARTSPSIFIYPCGTWYHHASSRACPSIYPSCVRESWSIRVCRDILHTFIYLIPWIIGGIGEGLNCIFDLASILKTTRFPSLLLSQRWTNQRKADGSGGACSALKLNEYEVSHELCGRIVNVSRAKIG